MIPSIWVGQKYCQRGPKWPQQVQWATTRHWNNKGNSMQTLLYSLAESGEHLLFGQTFWIIFMHQHRDLNSSWVVDVILLFPLNCWLLKMIFWGMLCVFCNCIFFHVLLPPPSISNSLSFIYHPIQDIQLMDFQSTCQFKLKKFQDFQSTSCTGLQLNTRPFYWSNSCWFSKGPQVQQSSSAHTDMANRLCLPGTKVCSLFTSPIPAHEKYSIYICISIMETSLQIYVHHVNVT